MHPATTYKKKAMVEVTKEPATDPGEGAIPGETGTTIAAKKSNRRKRKLPIPSTSTSTISKRTRKATGKMPQWSKDLFSENILQQD